ncbi:class GN sortase [Arenimonas fontis]|uniref:Class GN sortase n=1 Tax=Arenimonas fontis TaxID=2608255 RepID=A0A5B2ZD69_9GAMM|nr:class GN sortase [Arenimonas fontis]KAA2285021.1 class GN sortase [Arenimonas fontis]
MASRLEAETPDASRAEASVASRSLHAADTRPCAAPGADRADRRRSASRTQSRDRDVPPPHRRLARWLGLAAVALALHAVWMPAKAALSQALLRASWEANRADGGVRRPWPWADTHAVARLRQRKLGVDQVVLAGDDGRALAFGPGWAAASAAPGSGHGATIISGHRDTHFAWLRHLRPGDEVELETGAGLRRYRLASTHIADARETRLDPYAAGHRLILVTCWPFDATTPRGPLRYVLSFEAVEEEVLAA